jgi:hypothetical protein
VSPLTNSPLMTLNFDDPTVAMPHSNNFGLVTTLRVQSSDFSQVESRVVPVIAEAVRTNPHITLQIVLEPLRTLSKQDLEALPSISRKMLDVSYASTSYLDRYYSLHPGHLLSAKRLFILLPMSDRRGLERSRLHEIGECATILWRGKEAPSLPLEAFEHWIEG